MAGGEPLRLAHRGDFRRAPENSLAAFAAALANPACDGLEFDVRAAADGVAVIHHDETLERVHGLAERVDALTSAALGARGIPTLAEVLEMAGPGPFLDVELKGDSWQAALHDLAAGRGVALERAVVSSFDVPALERVARLRPAWPRWLNAHVLDPATIADALALGCRGVAVDWRALDPGSVGRARAAGLDVASYTVHRRATFERLARLGVMAICVEGPALDGRTDRGPGRSPTASSTGPIVRSTARRA